MPQNSLYFIQPSIVERLLNGQFVARRRQSRSYRIRDRRNVLSPLNVTRRAIRYEPLVYQNRKEELVQAIQALNHPEKKLLLVSGPTGRGKTSFIRMIVEMMGGGTEQLLWFEVSRHTDYDEVVRFLVESMTELCRSMQGAIQVPERADPVRTLEALLQHAAGFPILIVIDNIEHLVTPDRSIRSRELKDALNFLLSFPNVKMILAGKLLPSTDMPSSSKGIFILELPPLDSEKSNALVKELLRSPVLKEQDWSRLVPFFQGEPYLLFLFATLLEYHPDETRWLQELHPYAENPKPVLMNTLCLHLNAREQQILSILALIRHSITPSGLRALVLHCEPSQNDFDFHRLDKSFLRLLLKKVYPPQLVLARLRNRNPQAGERDSIEAYYQLSELFQGLVIQKLPEEKQLQYHERLYQFYTLERSKHILERVYRARTQHLVTEAQYHQDSAKKRRRALALSDISGNEPVEAKPASFGRGALQYPVESGERESIAEEGILSAIPQESGRAASGLPVVSPPISIHVEPGATLYGPMQPAPFQLSPEDLRNLAELVARTGVSANPTNPEPAQSEISRPNSMETEPHLQSSADEAPCMQTEERETTPGIEVDPREKEIQSRLNRAILQHQRGSIARELLQLGQHRLKKGLLRNAESCLLKALDFAQETGEIPLEMKIHAVLGRHYREHYQHNQALRHLQEVQLLYEKTGQTEKEKKLLAHAYREMAEIHLYRRHNPEAIALLQQSLQLSPDQNAFHADILFRLGLALDDEGQLEEAVRCYEKSFHLSNTLNNDRASAAALYNLASLYFEQSELQKAQEAMERCLIHDQHSSSYRELLQSLMLLSRIREAQEKLSEAQECALKAHRIACELSSPVDVALTCLRLAHLAEKLESWSEAAEYYRQAQAVAGNELSEESCRMILHKLQSIEESLS